MEQFSLKKYLENPSRKVVTRSGHNVRILSTGTNALDFTVTFEDEYAKIITMAYHRGTWSIDALSSKMTKFMSFNTTPNVNGEISITDTTYNNGYIVFSSRFLSVAIDPLLGIDCYTRVHFHGSWVYVQVCSDAAMLTPITTEVKMNVCYFET